MGCLLIRSEGYCDSISFLLHALQLGLQLLQLLLWSGAWGLLFLGCWRLVFDCGLFIDLILCGCSIGAAGTMPRPSFCRRLCGNPSGGYSLSYHRGFCSANMRWAPILEKGVSRMWDKKGLAEDFAQPSALGEGVKDRKWAQA